MNSHTPDFIRTVTITLAEYDQLRRDAAPVQDRQRFSVSVLIDAYNEYIESYRGSLGYQNPNAQERLGRYLQYVQRCAKLGKHPVMFGNWQEWTKPGDTE